MNRIRIALIACALALSACATSPLEPATSLVDRITYAEGQYHGALDAVDSSLKAGTISSLTAQNITAQADDAQLILLAAKSAAEAGDIDTANAQLTLALTALHSLQDYLRAQGAQK